MNPSTLVGYWRQRGTPRSTPAVLPAVLQVTFDASQAATGTGVILPKGAIITGAQTLVGGGVAGTALVGTEADGGGFATELDVAAFGAVDTAGALVGSLLEEDTEVFAGVGAVAAPAETMVTVGISLIMQDS